MNKLELMKIFKNINLNKGGVIMKTELLRKIDKLIMEIWNDTELSNELKNEINNKLQEAQMLIQEGKL